MNGTKRYTDSLIENLTPVRPGDTYDRENVVKRLQAIGTARWEGRVPFMMQGQQVMNETGYDNAFGFLFDIVHHRGQITTYLRAMGSTVPQIYGPSADEPM